LSCCRHSVEARVHWWSLYAKMSATTARDSHYCTCLGQ